MNALRKIMDGVDKVFEFFEKHLSSVALLIFTVVIFANVIGRYIFHNSISWAEELSRYLNLVLVFLAISTGIKFDTHIGVDAVETLLVPKRFHKYMDILRFAITAVFCVITAWLGYKLAVQVSALKQTSPALRLPMWVPYLTLPIGLFMASVRSLIRIIRLIIDPPETDIKDVSKEVQDA